MSAACLPPIPKVETLLCSRLKDNTARRYERIRSRVFELACENERNKVFNYAERAMQQVADEEDLSFNTIKDIYYRHLGTR